MERRKSNSINVFPGHDGRVRNVKVKTRTGEYERPITKIAVIYPAEGFEYDSQEDEDYAQSRISINRIRLNSVSSLSEGLLGLVLQATLFGV